MVAADKLPVVIYQNVEEKDGNQRIVIFMTALDDVYYPTERCYNIPRMCSPKHHSHTFATRRTAGRIATEKPPIPIRIHASFMGRNRNRL